MLALLLSSAALHATWNAGLRSGADRLWSMTLLCATTSVAGLVAALVLPIPARASWPYLCASALLQVGSSLSLVRAYRVGRLSQVYPIARGSSPLLVTLGALVFAHEHLGAVVVVGVALTSLGIAGLAAGRGRPDAASLGAALLTGAFIASYTVVDGVGGRLSGSAFAYTAWLCVVQGVSMVLVYLVVRGRLRVDARSKETWKAVAAGVLSLASYAIFVWALSVSAMGATSALRETSGLFAALIGRAFLGEPLPPVRIAACACVVAGAVLLAS